MAEKGKTLVTGSTGFLGSRFMKMNDGWLVQSVSLQQTQPTEIDWTEIKTVVHFAGIAHRMEKTDPQLYFEVNRDLSVQLATCAKDGGVRHFVFLSTIKVFGEDPLQSELSIQSECKPMEPYGQSKLEAEQALLSMSDEEFTVAIIRPPLVYGPGVKGNLQKLMALIAGKGPLPFGGIVNQRSMIYRDNLLHFIIKIIEQNSSGIFMPKDDPPVSTTALVECLRDVINPGKRIIAIPVILRTALKLVKPGIYHRLFGNLVVNSTGASHPEGYEQLVATEEGLRLMAEDFLAKSSK